MSETPLLDASALDRLRRIGGDTLISRMVTAFLTHGPERIAVVRAALAAQDARGIEHAAHSLKSSAGNLGGARLQETAERLEQVAAAGTVDADAVARLIREFDETAEALRRALEEPVQ